MSLAEALRSVDTVRGWDWSRTHTRIGDFGWSYPDVLREYMTPDTRAVDVGTGGGEVFASVARPGDVALDFIWTMLAVARTELPCPLVQGDQYGLPFRPDSFDVVADRHVGVDPRQVLGVLRPRGIYVTQRPGGRICQAIFDEFGWGTNDEFWRREAAKRGRTYWNVEACAAFYSEHGCEIVRREEAYVDYEFLDEDSLAFWLANAPLPEKVDPDRHADVLEKLPLKTNWHAELLVVRR
jgi:hypothetical protein